MTIMNLLVRYCPILACDIHEWGQNISYNGDELFKPIFDSTDILCKRAIPWKCCIRNDYIRKTRLQWASYSLIVQSLTWTFTHHFEKISCEKKRTLIEVSFNHHFDSQISAFSWSMNHDYTSWDWFRAVATVIIPIVVVFDLSFACVYFCICFGCSPSHVLDFWLKPPVTAGWLKNRRLESVFRFTPLFLLISLPFP